MNREAILKICDRVLLEAAARLYGTHKENLKVYPGYEGAANLVYDYELDEVPMILRITFRPERTAGQIQAELYFVNYLADHGVRVSKPVKSRNGNLVETLQAEGVSFNIVSFIKGKGMRVPDNGYRYREEAPIEEYFRSWGRVLEQMHAASKHYVPVETAEVRPDWFGLHKDRLEIDSLVPAQLGLVRGRIHAILEASGPCPKTGIPMG
jgi:Ser/Thr protein kinase RdoA (MazF antagonist)